MGFTRLHNVQAICEVVMRYPLLVLVALLHTLAGKDAGAVPIDLNLKVTVNGLPANPSLPAGPVEMMFRLSFDNSTDIFDEAAGLTVTSFNHPTFSENIVFTYFQGTDELFIGGTFPGIFDGAQNLFFGTDDFRIDLQTVSSTPTFFAGLFVSPTVPFGGFFLSFDGSVTAVPAPGAWVFTGLGVIGIITLRRRSRRIPAIRD